MSYNSSRTSCLHEDGSLPEIRRTVKVVVMGDEEVGKSSLISTFVSRHFNEKVSGLITRVRLPPDTTTYLPHVGAAPPLYRQRTEKKDSTSQLAQGHATNYKGFVTSIVDTQNADLTMLDALAEAGITPPKGVLVGERDKRNDNLRDEKSISKENDKAVDHSTNKAPAIVSTAVSRTPDAAIAATSGDATGSSSSASLSSPTNSSGSGGSGGSGNSSASEKEKAERQMIQKHLGGSIYNVDAIVLVYDLTDIDRTMTRLEHHWLPLIEKCFGTHLPVILVGAKLDMKLSPAKRAAQFPLLGTSSSLTASSSETAVGAGLEASTISINTAASSTNQTAQQQQSVERQHLTSILLQYKCVRQCMKCSAKALYHITEVFRKAEMAVLYPMTPSLYDLSNDAITVECAKAFTRIFRLYDTDHDGLWSAFELEMFQRQCGGRIWGPLMSETIEKWRSAIQRKATTLSKDFMHTTSNVSKASSAVQKADTSVSAKQQLMRNHFFHPHPERAHSVLVDGKLTLAGFLALMELFMQKDKCEVPWRILRMFGYDDSLQMHVPIDILRGSAKSRFPRCHLSKIHVMVNELDGLGKRKFIKATRSRTRGAFLWKLSSYLFFPFLGRKKNDDTLPDPEDWDLSREAVEFLIKIFFQFNAKSDGYLSRQDMLAVFAILPEPALPPWHLSRWAESFGREFFPVCALTGENSRSALGSGHPESYFVPYDVSATSSHATTHSHGVPSLSYESLTTADGVTLESSSSIDGTSSSEDDSNERALILSGEETSDEEAEDRHGKPHQTKESTIIFSGAHLDTSRNPTDGETNPVPIEGNIVESDRKVAARDGLKESDEQEDYHAQADMGAGLTLWAWLCYWHMCSLANCEKTREELYRLGFVEEKIQKFDQSGKDDFLSLQIPPPVFVPSITFRIGVFGRDSGGSRPHTFVDQFLFHLMEYDPMKEKSIQWQNAVSSSLLIHESSSTAVRAFCATVSFDELLCTTLSDKESTMVKLKSTSRELEELSSPLLVHLVLFDMSSVNHDQGSKAGFVPDDFNAMVLLFDCTDKASLDYVRRTERANSLLAEEYCLPRIYIGCKALSTQSSNGEECHTSLDSNGHVVRVAERHCVKHNMEPPLFVPFSPSAREIKKTLQTIVRCCAANNSQEEDRTIPGLEPLHCAIPPSSSNLTRGGRNRRKRGLYGDSSSPSSNLLRVGAGIVSVGIIVSVGVVLWGKSARTISRSVGNRNSRNARKCFLWIGKLLQSQLEKW